jgi:hypothetical protein
MSVTVVPESRMVVKGRLTAHAISSGISTIDVKDRSCIRLLKSAAAAAMTGAGAGGVVAVVAAAVTGVTFVLSFFLFFIQGACPSMPPPLP